MSIEFWHEGYLTDNIEEALESLMMLPEAKDAEIMELAFDESEMKVGAPMQIRACNFEYQGKIIELVQPVGCPESYVAKELARAGKGIHHLAYALHGDYDAVVTDLKEKGWVIGMAACKFGNNNCFVTSPDGSVILELIEEIPG